jgi:hypothetical protein
VRARYPAICLVSVPLPIIKNLLGIQVVQNVQIVTLTLTLSRKRARGKNIRTQRLERLNCLNGLNSS